MDFSQRRYRSVALAGVVSLVPVSPGAGFLLSVRPSSPLSNSFFICSLEVGFLQFLGSSKPEIMPVFPKSFANALMLYLPQQKRGQRYGKRLLSGSKRRKRSMVALRWISLINICKLAVHHLSSSQTCKTTSSEKHSVLLLTFLSVSKIWCHQD